MIVRIDIDCAAYKIKSNVALFRNEQLNLTLSYKEEKGKLIMASEYKLAKIPNKFTIKFIFVTFELYKIEDAL